MFNKKEITGMYACIYMHIHFNKADQWDYSSVNGKKKQTGGKHRNCIEVNCTPNTQVCPVNSKSHCPFGLGHPSWHDPMWFLSPAHYMLNTVGSTRQEGFQELLIQLLLFDHSNNGAEGNLLLEVKPTPSHQFPWCCCFVQTLPKS